MINNFHRRSLECVECFINFQADKNEHRIAVLGIGVDVTGSDRLVGRLFDNRNYGIGTRLTKSDVGGLNQFYRMPLNINQYVSQLQTSDQFNSQTFHSITEYSDSLEQRNDWSNTEKHSSGGWLHKKTTYKTQTHTELYQSVFNASAELQGSIITESSEIKVGSFSLAKSSLILDPYFQQVVVRLPAQLNVHSYFQLFQQYGTHYVESGDIGGRYEHIYVLNTDLTKWSSETSHSVEDCVSQSTSSSVFFGVYKHNNADSTCTTDKSGQIEIGSGETVKYKKITNIEGGTLEPLSNLLVAVVRASNNVSTVSGYPDWVTSLERNPTVIKKSLTAVCELFDFANSPDLDAKLQACYDALELYVNPYRSASCPPCSNRGVAVNIDGVCQCECATGFGGADCSNPAEDTDEETNSLRSKCMRFFGRGFL